MGWWQDLFSGTPSKRQFAETIIRALTDAGDTRVATYDEENFQLLFSEDGGQSGTANLHNVYEEYCQRPKAERKQFLRNVAAAFLVPHKQIPSEFEDASHDVLPTIRHRAYFSLMELQWTLQGDEALDWPYQPVGEHLALGLVYDLPEAMLMLQQDQLEEWQISAYEALETAQRNLQEIDFSFAAIDEHLYISATGDNYDSARLLWLDLIQSLEVEGDYVAMIPNRDRLMITGSEDDVGLQMLIELAEEALAEPRPLTGIAFSLVHGEWEPWLPPKEHPLFPRFHELKIQDLAQAYAEQKKLLDDINESQGKEGVLVSSYSGLEIGDPSELVTFCVWGNGGENLLPVTDYVVFLDVDDTGKPIQKANATWNDVQQMLPGYLEETDLYPPRYRAREFPLPEDLLRIGRALQEFDIS